MRNNFIPDISMKAKIFVLFAIAALQFNGFSQDLVFRFINPAFGGDSFNYQWLLSSAEAQNKFTESDQSQFGQFSDDPLADFENSLNKQILNRLSKEIVDSQFGEEELSEGSYVIGNYQIDIGDSDGGLSIVILDLSSGDQSTIFIPYY